MIGPVVHDEDVVHPQPDAVVALRVERVGLGELRLHLAGPARAERVDADGGRRRARRPVEVHGRIGADHGRAGEVGVVVVRRREAGARPARHDAVGRGVGRVGGRRRDVVRRGAAVGPRHELVGGAARRLRRRRAEGADDADDGGERRRRRDRLSVEPELERARARRERELDRPRQDVALRRVGEAGGIANGQVDAVPDVGCRLARGRDRERPAGRARGRRR